MKEHLEDEKDKNSLTTSQLWFKLALVIVFLGVIITAFFFKKSGVISLDFFFEFLRKHPIIAPAIFVVVFAITGFLFFPTFPLNLGAGFLWGTWVGGLLTTLGVIVSSIASFYFARYIGLSFFQNRINPKAINWIVNKVDEHGWKTVAFMRMNPIFPLAVINYSLGLTSISFRNFIWPTVVFSLLPSIAVAAFGKSFQQIFYLGSLKGILISLVVGVASFLFLFKTKPWLSKWISNPNESNNE